jgi:hypothetical protein
MSLVFLYTVLDTTVTKLHALYTTITSYSTLLLDSPSRIQLSRVNLAFSLTF